MNRKGIFVILAVTTSTLILTIVLAVAFLFRSDIISGVKGSCDVAVSGDIAYAAIPPNSAEEQYGEADLVVEGKVCKVIRTNRDGDARREACPDCIGGGTANSQELVIKISKVSKGRSLSNEIKVRKPISAYLLKQGDEGVFYIDSSNFLIGEYWPPMMD